MTAAPRSRLHAPLASAEDARARWQAADRARGDHPLWCVACRGSGTCARYERLARVEREAWHALRIARSQEQAHSADTTPLGAATTAGDSTSDREVRDATAPSKPGQATVMVRAGGDAGSSVSPRALPTTNETRQRG